MNVPIVKYAEWLKNKGLKERTIDNYVYYLNKFTFGQFNQETVNRFLSSKANRNSVAKGMIVNLQKFLRVNYVELGLTKELKEEITDVELPILTGRAKVRVVNPIPHNYIPLIEQAFETEKEKLQLLLNYYCALRVGELLKIRIMSFDWEKWKQNTEGMGECRVFGKGDKEGIALVPAALMKRIARHIRSKTFNSVNSYLFIKDPKEGQKIKWKFRNRYWQDRLRRAGIKAGITKTDENGQIIKETAIYPHRLRHSYASYLLNVKKLDIRYIKEVLRHSSIKSTEIYTHVDKEALKEELSHGNTPNIEK